MIVAVVLALSLPGLGRVSAGQMASRFEEQAPPVVAETLLVARHDLARGVALTAADIDTVIATEHTRGHLPGAHPREASGPIIGWLTRRIVRAGEPLRAPAVEPPPVVARGARVTVVWETAGLRVTRDGTAVGAAHLGERVVVGVDAHRRLTGIATGAGTVTVVP